MTTSPPTPYTGVENLEVMRDDREVFARFVEARRNRRDDWYIHPAGHIDVCNINVPVRDGK